MYPMPHKPDKRRSKVPEVDNDDTSVTIVKDQKKKKRRRQMDS